MKKDLSIIYNGKLLEVEESLKQLKELGFDIQKLKKAIEKIDQKVESDIEDIYLKFDKITSKSFLHQALLTTYSEAASKLDKIKRVIDDEYQEYLKINAKCEFLEHEMENISEQNINKVVSKGLELLSEIRDSSIIDYKMEEKMIESVYMLIYKIIKLELIYKGTSEIINKVSADETDCAYIARLVKENIDGLKAKFQVEAKKIITSLAADGLTNDDYLNINLLNTIITSEDNELSKRINTTLLANVDNYEELEQEYKLLCNNTQTLEDKNIQLQKNQKQTRLKKIKKRIFLNINTLLIAAGILTNGYVLKDVTRHKEYKTITTTYDSETKKTKTQEDYEPEKEYELTITEYTPWQEPGFFRKEYSRNVYNYDLSNLKIVYKELEDYLTEDLKGVLIPIKSTQSQEEKPKDIDCLDSKYVVKEVDQDLQVYNLEITPRYWALSTFLSSTVFIILDLLIALKLISKVSYKTRKEEYKEAKKSYEENNVKLLEAKEELTNLTLQLIDLRETIMNTYERLPKAVKEMPKIKQKILELENKTNS